MKTILKRIEPIAWHCSRKSFVALPQKYEMGGGGKLVKAVPSRLGLPGRLLAASLLVFATLLCLLPEAKAVSPSWMYADEANGTRITSDNIQGRTVRSTIAVSHLRIYGYPYGTTNYIGTRFSISNLSRGCSNRCVVFTIGYTGGNPSSNTRYRIFVHENGLIGGSGNVSQNAGNFEIRRNPANKSIEVISATGQPTEAGGTSTIRVRLGAAPSGNVTVAVSVSDTTEATVSPTSLSFTSTNFRTHKTVTVTGKNDSVYDGTKSYNVIFNPSSTADSGYNGLANKLVARTTTDNETAPTVTLALGSTSISENGGSTGVTASIGATDALTEANIVITVGAASSSDYNLTTNRTLTIAAGQRSSTGTVSITAVDNSDWAASKSVTVTGTVTAPAGIGNPSSQTLTITNDDFPTLTISSPAVTEGDSGQTSMTFTVTRSYAIPASSTVAYAEITAMSDRGTATSGTDFAALTAGTLTFASGSSATQSFTVMVNGDTTPEPYETVKVRLSGTTNAVLSGGGTTLDGTGIIQNDDTPTVSINTPTATEGNSGSVDLTFTVSLNYPFTQQVTVGYADAGTGTATSGTDYTAITAGTLTFVAGDSSETITVSVQGDAIDEPNETILVTLSSLTGAVFSGGVSSITGTGTITDDETPAFSIDSPSVTEGDSGSTNLVFTVSLSQRSYQQATVSYADASSGTATSGTDYTSVTAGMLTFAAGETSKTIAVSVTGDTSDETDETVVITLSNESAGTSITTASGTGTIEDDDPKISIDSPSVVEGDSSSVNLTFTVTLSASSTSQYTVNYADAGTGTAISGTDYTAVVAGMLTFAVGETSKTITVSVAGDTNFEANETVVVALSDVSSGASIAMASGTGTIVNDDPGLSIDSPNVVEGDSGSVDLTFTVTLLPAATVPVTVNYADAGTGTATSGRDYTAIAAGRLTFSVGTTSRMITVSVTGDTVNEMNETVVLTLSNATGGAGIATLSGTGTITDNDTPGFSINSPSVAEGDSSTANLTFTVSLRPASYQQVTVDYADAGNGTATSGTDYAAIAGGTLTFAVGETSKTIVVTVTGDTVNEANETVVIMLSNVSSGADIATATGTGTITDNDIPGFSIDSPSVEEGDTESVNLTFTVSLSQASYQQVTVNYADAGTGTAESGVDYAAVAGDTLTFAPGETSQTIDVSVIGDVLSEQDETVVLVISNPNPSYTIEVASGTGTITDNDASVLSELDMKIVAEVTREIATSVVTAISSRTAAVTGGAVVGAPPGTGFSDGGLLSILERVARHNRERERGLKSSELSLYRSLDGESFVYSPKAVGLGVSGTDDASDGGLSGDPTVWGSVDYRKLSGGGADALQWDGELAAVNIGTDMMIDSGVLVGLAAGMSKGSFGYHGSTGGTAGTLKLRMKTLNPYVGWSLSGSASLWAAVGYGKGKINYNDDAVGESANKMSMASAALGGRYRLYSADGSSDGYLIQVDLKGEAWGLQTKVEGDERRPTGSNSQVHGVRVAVERHQNSALESGALLTLSGEAGLRWDGGDGDTGTGIEMGGTADYGNPTTGMKMVATTRALLDHESDRKEWGASLMARYRMDSRETGLTYRSSLSYGQAESGVDSLWDSSATSRASEDEQLTTRLETEVGYRLFGASGLHTPYVGFGAEDSGTRDYRIGMRYASESALSSGLEFERREANNKRPDHRVMLTGQINW